MSQTDRAVPADDHPGAGEAQVSTDLVDAALDADTDATADLEARAVLEEFLPPDAVVRKRVFSSLLRGLTRGTS